MEKSKAKFGSVKEEVVDLKPESGLDSDNLEQNEFNYNLHNYVHSSTQFFVALSEELFGTLAFNEELMKLVLGDTELEDVLDDGYFTPWSLEQCKSSTLFSKIFLKVQNGDSKDVTTFGEEKQAILLGTLLWYQDQNLWLADSKKQVSSRFMDIVDDLRNAQQSLRDASEQESSIASKIEEIIASNSSPIKVTFYGPMRAGKSTLINTLCNFQALNVKTGGVGAQTTWVHKIQQSNSEDFVLKFKLISPSIISSTIADANNNPKDKEAQAEVRNMLGLKLGKKTPPEGWTVPEEYNSLLTDDGRDLIISLTDYQKYLERLEQISTLVEHVSVQVPKSIAIIPREFQFIDLPGVDDRYSMRSQRAVEALTDSDIILCVDEATKNFQSKRTRDLAKSIKEKELISTVNVLLVATQGDVVETKFKSEIRKGKMCFKKFTEAPGSSGPLGHKPYVLVGKGMVCSHNSLWSFLKEVARTRTLELQAQLRELDIMVKAANKRKEKILEEHEKYKKLMAMLSLFGSEAEQTGQAYYQDLKEQFLLKLKDHTELYYILKLKWEPYFEKSGGPRVLLATMIRGGYYNSPARGDIYLERDVRFVLYHNLADRLVELDQKLYSSLSALATGQKKDCVAVNGGLLLEFDIVEQRLDQIPQIARQFKEMIIKAIHQGSSNLVKKMTQELLTPDHSKLRENADWEKTLQSSISEALDYVTTQIKQASAPIIESAYKEAAEEVNKRISPVKELTGLTESFSKWEKSWLRVKFDSFSTVALKSNVHEQPSQ